MVLHVFECSHCHHEQKHVTSTPTPLGLSYTSECNHCQTMQTFSFVREGNRKEDWYSNILAQIKRKKNDDQSYTPKRKDDGIDKVAM